MSVLVKSLRAVLFSNLRPEMPVKLRKKAWEVFNSIASDIDVSGYNDDTMSPGTAELIEQLEAILSGSDILDVEPELDEPVTTEDTPTPKKPDVLDLELEDEPS